MRSLLTGWFKRFAVGLLATLLLPVVAVLLLVASWWLLVLLWHFPILLLLALVLPPAFSLMGLARETREPEQYFTGPRGGVYYMTASGRRYI
jgi:hypothetical protein